MSATLSATRRDSQGKGVARKLRSAGRVPAVVYGHGDATESLSLDAHELERLLSTISVENTLISLSVDGAPRDVLIRELQMHPYKPEVLHVDFIQLHAGEVIKLAIPVRVTGTPVGVHTGGGVMDHVLYEIEVECLPGNIPEAAEVDVSGLDVGEAMRVRDIQIPDVTILTDGEVVVATVLAPTVHADEVPSTVAPAEPEVIRGRDAGEE